MASVLPADDEIPALILGPDSVSWRLGSDLRTMFVAGRALLLQVSHPTVGAGVAEHSNFLANPWKRLFETLDFVYLSIYGGERAAVTGRRVREMHRQIKGVTPEGRRYHALEPEAYAWVHATLLDSFVVGTQRFVGPLRPADRDRYYEEWMGIGRLLGVRDRDLPPDWASFRPWFDAMVAERLEHNAVVDQVAHALSAPTRPPAMPGGDLLWKLLRVPPSRAIRTGTIGTLPPVLRERFGLRWTRANEAELIALGAASRALTPVLPADVRRVGPRWLRWREHQIARGAFV